MSQREQLMVKCGTRQAWDLKVFWECWRATYTQRCLLVHFSSSLGRAQSSCAFNLKCFTMHTAREPERRQAELNSDGENNMESLLMRLESSPNVKCSWWVRVLCYLCPCVKLMPESVSSICPHLSCQCREAKGTQRIDAFLVEHCCLRCTFTRVSGVL